MEKEQIDDTLKSILGRFHSEFEKQGVELIAVVCASEEEQTTFLMANPTFNEIEQRVIAEKVMPAIMEAGRILWGKGNA
jgi:hypothetical protein